MPSTMATTAIEGARSRIHSVSMTNSPRRVSMVQLSASSGLEPSRAARIGRATLARMNENQIVSTTKLTVAMIGAMTAPWSRASQ